MATRKNPEANARNNLKSSIEGNIKTLQTAEATAHKTLAILSRELLLYVPDSGDIGMVNRLLAACKTSNRDYVFLFFQHFLEWKVTPEKTFGEKMPGKRINAKKSADRVAFLSDENNNIWTWSKENIKPAERRVNYFTQVQNAVSRALEKGEVEEENGKRRKMTAFDIIEAMRLGGVEVTAIIEASERYAEQVEEALQRENNPEAQENQRVH